MVEDLIPFHKPLIIQLSRVYLLMAFFMEAFRTFPKNYLNPFYYMIILLVVKYLFENNKMSYCLFSLQLSVYGESAWEYDDVRKECYRHTFLKEEPDLNLMNDDVRTEMRVLYLFVLVISYRIKFKRGPIAQDH